MGEPFVNNVLTESVVFDHDAASALGGRQIMSKVGVRSCLMCARLILSDLIAALRSRRIAAKLVVQAQLVSVSCPS